MNLKKLTIVGMCTAGLLLAAPLSAKTEKTINGYSIDVVLNTASNAKIINPTIKTKDGTVWVMGKVKRQNPQMRVPMGHIDITVTDSNGKQIMDSSVSYSPTRVHKERRKASHFALPLASKPPKGSQITISYHKNVFHHSHAAQNQHDMMK